MDIVVLDDNPIYNGDIYRLSFIFGTQYPIGKSMTRDGNLAGYLEHMLTSPSPFNRSARSLLHQSQPYHHREQRNTQLRRPTHRPHLRRHTRTTHHRHRRPPYPNPPTHLLQRHHLPRPARRSRLVACTIRRVGLRIHTEHAYEQHKECQTRRRRCVLPEYGCAGAEWVEWKWEE
jgi:hypothetical protein